MSQVTRSQEHAGFLHTNGYFSGNRRDQNLLLTLAICTQIFLCLKLFVLFNTSGASRICFAKTKAMS